MISISDIAVTQIMNISWLAAILGFTKECSFSEVCKGSCYTITILGPDHILRKIKYEFLKL